MHVLVRVSARAIFSSLPCFLSGFLSFPFVCYYQRGTTTVADCSDTQLEINHFTCRRKPPLFFLSLFLFLFGFFFSFFPLHLSGAAVRASVKVHQVSAPGPPPAHPLSPAPDLYLSSPPILTSVESGCFAVTLPPPSGPPCALPLPPSSPPHLSCQTNLQLLLLTSTFPVKVLCPHTYTHAHTQLPSSSLQPFLFFLSTHIAAPKA